MEVKVTSLPNQGIVVTTLTGCTFDALDEIDKHLNTTTPIRITYNTARYRMNYQYRAVARCHPGDTWDETIGKDLSFERAYAKYMKAKKRVILRFCEDVGRNLTDIKDYVNTRRKYRDREINLNNLYEK